MFDETFCSIEELTSFGKLESYVETSGTKNVTTGKNAPNDIFFFFIDLDNTLVTADGVIFDFATPRGKYFYDEAKRCIRELRESQNQPGDSTGSEQTAKRQKFDNPTPKTSLTRYEKDSQSLHSSPKGGTFNFRASAHVNHLSMKQRSATSSIISHGEVFEESSSDEIRMAMNWIQQMGDSILKDIEQREYRGEDIGRISVTAERSDSRAKTKIQLAQAPRMTVLIESLFKKLVREMSRRYYKCESKLVDDQNVEVIKRLISKPNVYCFGLTSRTLASKQTPTLLKRLQQLGVKFSSIPAEKTVEKTGSKSSDSNKEGSREVSKTPRSKSPSKSDAISNKSDAVSDKSDAFSSENEESDFYEELNAELEYDDSVAADGQPKTSQSDIPSVGTILFANGHTKIHAIRDTVQRAIDASKEPAKAINACLVDDTLQKHEDVKRHVVERVGIGDVGEGSIATRRHVKIHYHSLHYTYCRNFESSVERLRVELDDILVTIKGRISCE